MIPQTIPRHDDAHPTVRPSPHCATCHQLQEIIDRQRGEILRGARQREELKQSLEAHDGAAGFWRRTAKEAIRLHQNAHLRARHPEIRAAIEALRRLVIEAAARAEQVDGVKMRLWEFWNTLPPDDATRTALRNIWSDL